MHSAWRALKAAPWVAPAKGAQDETVVPPFFPSDIPARGRCKVTQQPEAVAYIPKTPAWVQGPATAGGRRHREKERRQGGRNSRAIHVSERCAPNITFHRI